MRKAWWAVQVPMQESWEKRSKLEKIKILEHYKNYKLSFKRHVRIGNRNWMFTQKELISEEDLRSIFLYIKKVLFALIHEEVIVKGKKILNISK